MYLLKHIKSIRIKLLGNVLRNLSKHPLELTVPRHTAVTAVFLGKTPAEMVLPLNSFDNVLQRDFRWIFCKLISALSALKGLYKPVRHKLAQDFQRKSLGNGRLLGNRFYIEGVDPVITFPISQSLTVFQGWVKPERRVLPVRSFCIKPFFSR